MRDRPNAIHPSRLRQGEVRYIPNNVRHIVGMYRALLNIDTWPRDFFALER
jgi:hypothetical protein